MIDFLMGLLSGAFATAVGFVIGYKVSKAPADNKFYCWLSHRWSVWGNPVTPPGYYETFKIQYRTCSQCNKTEARSVR